MEVRLKMLFEYEDFENQYALESMWVFSTQLGYKIDNIPFYVKGFAYGDIVSAKELEGELYANELVKESGHSTIRILFNSIEEVSGVREYLKNLGCESEISDLPILVAVDIPPSVAYNNIKTYLDIGEEKDLWSYQEACIAQ